jgi:crotonobetainyl-CoA:carnitine CoA-transferase CaiB-like acyl-CoA transferase
MGLPLEDILVVDFSQFLAGPSASLRLADLGARVIKVERPPSGEATRALTLAGQALDGDSLLFHTINRNKESLAADLKDARDMAMVQRLVARADVVIQAFRPGVMERAGLGYEDVRAFNPRVVYASVSGFGAVGPWRDKPGQDLVVQALTGLPWLNGSADDPPVAFGLSVVDQFAGAQLCQGILACLVRRSVSGEGGLVEVSLLEAAMDLQFEGFTTYLNDARLRPQRSSVGGAHPYLPAPYGIYVLADGHLAIAMAPVSLLGELLTIPSLAEFRDHGSSDERRDEIKSVLARELAQRRIDDVLGLLESNGVWCAPVLTWDALVEHDGFRSAEMLIDVGVAERSFHTTRCPITIDGKRPVSPRGAPRLGEHELTDEELCP